MARFDSIQQAKLVFMGTPALAAEVLSSLLDAGFRFVAVISSPDKPIGRKQILAPTPVKEVALAHNIPVYQPTTYRNGGDEFLKNIDCDLILTMAYGKIVPLSVLHHPRFGCLNLHGSLLPYYRGASPIQSAILNGERKTGVSLMEMVEQMDAGQVFASKEIDLEETDDTASLSKKMAIAATKLCLESILPYLNGELIGVPQEESKATYCGKIAPEMERLSLAFDGKAALRYVKALSPAPGAYLYLGDRKLKILDAKWDERDIGQGKVVALKKELLIGFAKGSLNCLLVQMEGKKPMAVRDFLNGFHIEEGLVAS